MRRQMRLDADRAHAGAAAAMRDAEGLVQVQVADIAAQIARARQADHRVHVGAVDIDLAAMLMGDLADVVTVSSNTPWVRGIGDHAGRQIVAVLFGLGAEILQIDVAVVGRLDDTTFSPPSGRGRVGAVRRHRDQADVAVRLARAR